MSRDLKTYNLLLDYLSGKLGEEEKLALEKLWADPDQRSELLETGAIEHGGDAFYKEKFDALHQQMKVEQARRTRFIWIAGAAAAAVILALWLFNFSSFGFNRFDQEEFYAENTPSYFITARSENKTGCENLPPDSVKIIEALEGRKLENICNRLLAVAYYKIGDYAKSYTNWKNIDSGVGDREEKQFYLALTALKTGRIEEARSLLSTFTKLNSSEFSRYKKAALELEKTLPEPLQETESK